MVEIDPTLAEMENVSALSNLIGSYRLNLGTVPVVLGWAVDHMRSLFHCMVRDLAHHSISYHPEVCHRVSGLLWILLHSQNCIIRHADWI